MKLGIAFLVIGILLLILAIPYSTVGIISGITQLEEGNISGEISAYYRIIGVIVAFMMTVVGVVRVFISALQK
jgi:uncharacterized membrane protein